jgi:hypothetical protein
MVEFEVFGAGLLFRLTGLHVGKIWLHPINPAGIKPIWTAHWRWGAEIRRICNSALVRRAAVVCN